MNLFSFYLIRRIFSSIKKKTKCLTNLVCYHFLPRKFRAQFSPCQCVDVSIARSSLSTSEVGVPKIMVNVACRYFLGNLCLKHLVDVKANDDLALKLFVRLVAFRI